MLQGAVQGIAELITRPGLINVDFADVRTVMSETGMAMMGTGRGTGEDRARTAAEMAVSSPLLEDINLAGAQGILVNVTAGLDLSLGELDEVGSTVKQFASDDATVVVGTVIDPDMQDELRVTVVATGLGRGEMAAVVPAPVVHQTKPRPTVVSGGARAPQNVAPSSSAQPNWDSLQAPAFRRRAVGDGLAAVDPDILDIPAFLRRQAD